MRGKQHRNQPLERLEPIKTVKPDKAAIRARKMAAREKAEARRRKGERTKNLIKA